MWWTFIHFDKYIDTKYEYFHGIMPADQVGGQMCNVIH